MQRMLPGSSPESRIASLTPVRIDGVTYFAAADLAAILKISRQTLWRWRRAGKIPLGHRFRDGQTFFTQNEVDEITEFAHRIEPIDASDRSQLELFKPRRT
jgi:Helix-turn-helix domain